MITRSILELFLMFITWYDECKKYLVLTSFIFILPFHNIIAQEKPKLVVLPFSNVDQDKTIEYLGLSISDAITTDLQKKFVFELIDNIEIEQYSIDNFFYVKEYYTKTSSIKLGLELKQDIIISGFYKVKNEIITININIYSIKDKKVVTSFSKKGKINNSIFGTLAKIAEYTSQKVKTILPSKEDWEKKGFSFASNKVFFDKPSLIVYGGAMIYHGGFNEFFEPQLPSLGIGFQIRMPVLSKRFFSRVDIELFRHLLDPKAGVPLNRISETTDVQNIKLSFELFYQFWDVKRFTFLTGIGGASVIKSSTISGTSNANALYAVPGVTWKLTSQYTMTSKSTIVLEYSGLAEIERTIFNFNQGLHLGIMVSF